MHALCRESRLGTTRREHDEHDEQGADDAEAGQHARPVDRDFGACRLGESPWMTGAASTIVSSAAGGPTSTTGTFAVSSEKAPDVVPAAAACFA